MLGPNKVFKRVYEGCNASGGIWPPVYTGLNALAENLVTFTHAIRVSTILFEYSDIFHEIFQSNKRVAELWREYVFSTDYVWILLCEKGSILKFVDYDHNKPFTCMPSIAHFSRRYFRSFSSLPLRLYFLTFFSMRCLSLTMCA